MELHYNAFISYKHAPLDTKVAAEVQRQLERFKIPGAIQKAAGIKRINRIFRDKEELTLTSDLNETIENALNNSDFLIVICSHATKESIWVLREIEFFLKTHSRKQILTVVAEGEPVDVVPQILQYQEMELMTEDGNVEMVQVPIEPLSCDYRGSFRKARRDELPRLAAALLGCSYDDLRRRQRQYRMRRIVAAAAALGLALTGLAAYYAWSAAQIQKNYEQSLRNQSEYLASEAQKLLDSGDRLTAMLLALEALPSEDSDRPVLAKAVNALSEAAYAYVSYGAGDLTLDKAYTSKGELDEFVFDEAETMLAVCHSNYYNLDVWDTESGGQLFTQAYDEQIDAVYFSLSGDLLVLAGKLYCYDTATWQAKWEYTFDRTPSQMAVSAGGVIAVTTVNQITMLDGDGAFLTALDAPLDEEGQPFQLSDVAISDDGKYVAAALAINEEEYAGCLVTWDVQTGESFMNTTYLYWVRELRFLSNGTVLAASLTSDDVSMTYTDSNGNVSHFLYPGSLEVLCIDTQANTLWNRQVEFSQQYYGANTEEIDFLTEEEVSVPAVACAVGNVCQILDLESGETLERVDFPDPILTLQTGNNGFACILETGARAKYIYSSRIPIVHDEFVGDLIMAAYGQSIYVVQKDSNRILRYTWDIYDENWIALSGTEDVFTTVSGRLQTENGVLVLSNGDTLRYYDAVQQKLLWTWELPEEERYAYSIVGLEDSGDTALLVNTSYDNQHLLRFDLATGETTRIELLPTIRKSTVRYCGGAVYYQSDWSVTDDETGEIWYEEGIVRVDLETGEIENIAIDMNFSPTGFVMDTKGETFLFYAAYDSEVGIYADGEFSEVTGVYDPAVSVLSDDAKLAAFAVDNHICVTDMKIQVQYAIPTNGMHPQAMHFYEDQLLVAYDNGKLYRYASADGEYLGNLDISVGGYSLENYIMWDFSQEGTLVLQLGNELNLIDTEDWQLYTQVSRCVSYLPERNVILVMGDASGSSGFHLGMYEVYTVEGLIEKAKELLNGLELTQEQKTQYGISD